MKHIISVMLACMLLCMLAACGQKTSSVPDSTSTTTSTGETATSETAESEEEWSPELVPTPTPYPSFSMSKDEFDNTTETYSQEGGWEKYLEDQGIEITDEIRADIENPASADAGDMSTQDTESSDGNASDSNMSEKQKVELAIAEANYIRTQHANYSRYVGAYSELISLMKNTPNYSLSDASVSTADFEARLTEYQGVSEGLTLLSAEEFSAVYNSIIEAQQKLTDQGVTIPVNLLNEIAWIETDCNAMTNTGGGE